MRFKCPKFLLEKTISDEDEESEEKAKNKGREEERGREE